MGNLLNAHLQRLLHHRLIWRDGLVHRPGLSCSRHRYFGKSMSLPPEYPCMLEPSDNNLFPVSVFWWLPNDMGDNENDNDIDDNDNKNLNIVSAGLVWLCHKNTNNNNINHINNNNSNNIMTFKARLRFRMMRHPNGPDSVIKTKATQRRKLSIRRAPSLQ